MIKYGPALTPIDALLQETFLTKGRCNNCGLFHITADKSDDKFGWIACNKCGHIYKAMNQMVWN